MKRESEPINKSSRISIRLKEFMIPPTRDCLVIGRKSAIGCVALKKAVSLLHASPFTDIHPDDEVISDILVRESILLKVSSGKLTELILRLVKPLMRDDEVLHLDLDVEVNLEVEV